MKCQVENDSTRRYNDILIKGQDSQICIRVHETDALCQVSLDGKSFSYITDDQLKTIEDMLSYARNKRDEYCESKAKALASWGTTE